MADIYHTFLDDEQEAEYHFRKAHGADKCAVCGGEGGKRYTDYVPYGSTRAAYETWDECEACDGLGYERVSLHTLDEMEFESPNYSRYFPALLVKKWDGCIEVDQHVLMGILQRFAPYAYAAEMRRQAVTP